MGNQEPGRGCCKDLGAQIGVLGPGERLAGCWCIVEAETDFLLDWTCHVRGEKRR